MRRVHGWSSVAVGMAGALTMIFAGALPPEAGAQPSRNTRDKGEAKAQGQAAAPVLDLERGAREAPAIVNAAGIGCTVTQAAFVGAAKDPGGAVLSSYEVACREGLGYVLQQGAAGTAPKAFDCVVLQTVHDNAVAKGQPGGVRCQLQANAQPALTLQPVVAQAGGTCTVASARYRGTAPGVGTTVYEISCGQGGGYILQRPAKAADRPTLVSCLSVAGSPNACTLTPHAQVIASIVPIAAQTQRQCDVSDARVAGRNPTTNNEIVEIGCRNGAAGFLMEVNSTGGLVRALDCDKVSGVNCQFTNAAALQAAGQQALMARLRAAPLGDCTPADTRMLGTELSSRRDVVEVSCSNRPYGAVVLLASQTNPRNEVYDCLFAPRWGGTCQLTQTSAAYPRVSSALLLRGRNANCAIRDARWMGVTPQGESWFEIACQDGRSFLIDYRGNGQVAKLLTCREGQSVAGGCRAGIGASVPKD